MVDTATHIGERIRAALNAPDLTVRGLADRCGVSDKAVYKWMKTGQVSRRHLSAIADYLRVQPDWLLSEDYATPQSVPEHVREPGGSTGNTSPAPAPVRAIPEISWVQAGQWHEAVDLHHPGDAEQWHYTAKNVGEAAFYLRVNGDSMIAPYGRGYPPGCLILVDPDAAADPGRRVIARKKDSCEVTFKELAYDAGQYFLKPLNPQYRTIEVDGEWEIVGVVRESIIPED